MPSSDNDRYAAFERVRLRSVGVEDEIKNMEGGALSEADFAARLGITSIEMIHNYRKNGKILAFEINPDVLLYPAWQIHRGRLLPGLSDAIAALTQEPRSPFSIANFFLSGREDLDGKRPLDLLRENRVDEVIADAGRYGQMGA